MARKHFLAVSCYMALNMLKPETTKKFNIRRRQKMTAMDSAYLEQVILAGINNMGET